VNNRLDLVIRDGLWFHYENGRWRVNELRVGVEVEKTVVAPIPIVAASTYVDADGKAHAARAQLDVTAAPNELRAAELFVSRDGRFNLIAEYGGQSVNVVDGAFGRKR
jgi:hypothetical protein